jgi:hypothetical protein
MNWSRRAAAAPRDESEGSLRRHYATGHTRIKGGERAPPLRGAPAGEHGGRLDATQI